MKSTKSNPKPRKAALKRPAIGRMVVVHDQVIEVTGHTKRGFSYKGGKIFSVPRLCLRGDGTGEYYLDTGVTWKYAETAMDAETQLRDALRLFLGVSTLPRGRNVEVGPEFLAAQENARKLLESISPSEKVPGASDALIDYLQKSGQGISVGQMQSNGPFWFHVGTHSGNTSLRKAIATAMKADAKTGSNL